MKKGKSGTGKVGDRLRLIDAVMVDYVQYHGPIGSGGGGGRAAPPHTAGQQPPTNLLSRRRPAQLLQAARFAVRPRGRAAVGLLPDDQSCALRGNPGAARFLCAGTGPDPLPLHARTRARCTNAGAGRGTCGRTDFSLVRWTAIIFGQRCATSTSTRCGRIWPKRRPSTSGRARGRTSRAATGGVCSTRICGSKYVRARIGRRCWEGLETKKRRKWCS